MSRRKKDSSYNYKIAAVDAAKDLGYGDDVVAKIWVAKTDGEVERIMRSARLEKFK